jgi:uncharacterized protein HemX
MNAKVLTAVALAAVLALGGLVMTHAQVQVKKDADPRIDKVLEQQEQILKNQQDILKQLGELKEGLMQLRRRSS